MDNVGTLGGKEFLGRIEPCDARDNLAHRGLGRGRRVGHGHQLGRRTSKDCARMVLGMPAGAEQRNAKRADC